MSGQGSKDTEGVQSEKECPSEMRVNKEKRKKKGWNTIEELARMSKAELIEKLKKIEAKIRHYEFELRMIPEGNARRTKIVKQLKCNHAELRIIKSYRNLSSKEGVNELLIYRELDGKSQLFEEFKEKYTGKMNSGERKRALPTSELKYDYIMQEEGSYVQESGVLKKLKTNKAEKTSAIIKKKGV